MASVGGVAVVLGPGGLVGTAWLLGLAAGLRQEGVDLAAADLIVGTSAGAIAGALVATGGDPDRVADVPAPTGPRRGPVGDLLSQVFATLGDPGLEPAEARRRAGRLALAAPTVDEETHLASMRYLIGTDEWPSRPLLITAVDLESGGLVVWDNGSGVPLTAAVAASCSVPAVYPPITVAGRRYFDGGLAGGSHVRLAGGADTIILVEPFANRVLPPGLGDGTGDADVAGDDGVTDAGAVVRVAPDHRAREAFGPDLGDHARWRSCFDAGVRQASDVARRVRPALGSVPA